MDSVIQYYVQWQRNDGDNSEAGTVHKGNVLTCANPKDLSTFHEQQPLLPFQMEETGQTGLLLG